MTGAPYPPPPGNGRRFPWLAVLGSIGLVLILVVGVTVVLVWDRDDDPATQDGPSRSEELRERLLAESRVELPTTVDVEQPVPGYDYAAPVAGVATTADLPIPATYDADVSDPWQGAPGKIEVYADAALTKPVPILILPDLTMPDSDPHLAIKPTAVQRAHITRADDGLWYLTGWIDESLGNAPSWSDLKAAFIQ